MWTSRTEPTDQDIYRFCETWVSLLSAGLYESAAAALWHSDDYRWTGQQLRRAVETFGLITEAPNASVQISSYESASGESPRETLRCDVQLPGVIYSVHPRWPILVKRPLDTTSGSLVVAEVFLYYAVNGRWSNLSSTLSMRKVPAGIVCELETVDVS
jgi:hypothetical protein